MARITILGPVEEPRPRNVWRSPMRHETLAIPDLVLFTPDIHGDERGTFAETFRADCFEAAAGAADFVQDNQSWSKPAGTVRGLHFQVAPSAQGKLVRVLQGAIRDVAVDIRVGSETYGEHVAVELSAENWRQLWIPPGFAHGFVTLEPDTAVAYKVTAHYDAKAERGLAWDDPALGIDWGIDPGEATLSRKDLSWPRLADVDTVYFRHEGSEAVSCA